MLRVARDIMTPDPVCCSPHTTLDEVAKMMLQNDCGEIPIVDAKDCLIGVITDRDIVCRAVAQGKNPIGYTVESCMSAPVITVREDDSFEEIVATMEQHQVRRVPVVSDSGICAGIIAQADVARVGPKREVAELVREVSQQTDPLYMHEGDRARSRRSR
jgi:CBS domain-containing protein